ncbi:hypothetical protein [Bradyrhizobium sp.]|uniref:hypothetical protein n=1 Tax=Bradyrhizobium sp. TaxID=376 RepID=UPI003C63167D
MLEPTVDPVSPIVLVDACDEEDACDELLAVAEPHADGVVVPPPSKAPPDVVFGHGITSGLIPDGLSSVAPSGIVPELEDDDDSDGTVPSGEVAPMPGA